MTGKEYPEERVADLSVRVSRGAKRDVVYFMMTWRGKGVFLFDDESDSVFVKIGYSNNLYYRMTDLSYASPFPKKGDKCYVWPFPFDGSRRWPCQRSPRELCQCDHRGGAAKQGGWRAR